MSRREAEAALRRAVVGAEKAARVRETREAAQAAVDALPHPCGPGRHEPLRTWSPCRDCEHEHFICSDCAAKGGLSAIVRCICCSCTPCDCCEEKAEDVWAEHGGGA